MEPPVLVSVIVAIIAIVPGLWALINQNNKSKENIRLDMVRTLQHTIYDVLPPLQVEINKLRERTVSLEELPAEKLFKKMYEKPVIIRCKHCISPNVITSLNCTQCGAPLEVLNEAICFESNER